MTTPLDTRLLQTAIGTLELFGVYLGDRLGLYAALADGAPVTPGALAARCGIHPRYAREWLEQQAVAGILSVEDAAADAESRRYRLPAEHTAVLVDPTHASHLAPLARMVAGIGAVLEEVAGAYRSGAGVPYARYGADFRHGQGAINRPAFSTSLVDSWLPAVDGARPRWRRRGRRRPPPALRCAPSAPTPRRWRATGPSTSCCCSRCCTTSPAPSRCCARRTRRSPRTAPC